jgi:hypothetical protein
MARQSAAGFVQDAAGNVQAGVTVTVRVQGSAALADIYAAETGGSAISGSELTTDANGRYEFWAEPGSYYAEYGSGASATSQNHNLNTPVATVLDDFAAVAAYSRDENITTLILKDGHATDDGLGGVYYYDPTDTSSAADLPRVIVGADGARYKPAGKPTTALRLRGNIIAQAGDSISARSCYDGGTEDKANISASQGFTNWGRALARGEWRTGSQYSEAIGGSTTATLINTQLSLMLATFRANPGIGVCVVSMGTNDAQNGISLDLVKSRLQTFARACVDEGVVPIFQVPLPRTPSSPAAGFYERLAHHQEYIANQLPLDVPGALSYGSWQHMYDSAGDVDSGAAQSDLFCDGTHPAPRGAYLAGKQLAAVLDTLRPRRHSSHLGPRAIYDATENPLGPLVTPTFTTSAAYGGADGNISGNVPTGWDIERASGSQTIAIDVASVTDADGETVSACTIDITAGGARGNTVLSQDITPDASLADTDVKVRARVKVSNAVNLRMCELRNRYDVGGGGSTSRYDMFRHDEGGVSYYQPDGSYDLFLETPAITLGATPASDTLKPALLVGIELSGSVTVEVLSIEVVPA